MAKPAAGAEAPGGRLLGRHDHSHLPALHPRHLLDLGDFVEIVFDAHQDVHAELLMRQLAPAERGAWLEGRCEVLRMTRNLVFAQGLLTVRETPILRASSVMKLPPERDPAFAPIRKLFL